MTKSWIAAVNVALMVLTTGLATMAALDRHWFLLGVNAVNCIANAIMLAVNSRD